MAVRIIPAAQPANGQSAERQTRMREDRPKLKVAAYCRVSTELEEQESSYEAQVSHYTEFINGNAAWTLAGIYADEGISGTGTKKREQFKKMIKDCEADKIDMVITKSISRFARNTLDCLQYIRKLKALGIPILFEKENINTMDAKGELLITIMASIAQQESQSISQNVRMGIQYRFQQGRPMLQHNWFLGYTKEKNGDLQIVPEEADVVRRIFRDFLEGLSFGEIIQRLEDDGIKTGAGREKWYASTVQSMLKNEKYMGDLLLQKGYTVDFLTKEKVKNTGTFPQYYVENAHEPIVPREVFMQVQGEFLRRENYKLTTGKREMHRSNLGLNQRILCSECGSTYRRFAKQDGDGETDWRCRKRIQKGTPCLGRIVKEKDVKDAVVEAFNQLPVYRDDLIRKQERIRCLPLDQITTELTQVEEKQDVLEEAMSEYAETGVFPYDILTTEEEEIDRIKAEQDRLERRHDELLGQKAEYDIQQVQIQVMLELIHQLKGEQEPPELPPEEPDRGACYDYADFFKRTRHRKYNGPITAFSDDDVVRYVKSVTIHRNKIVVAFKAGIEIAIAK